MLSSFRQIRVMVFVIVAIFAEPAFALDPATSDSVNPSPHRISAEIATFDLPKSDEGGPAFGLGYIFRAAPGLELGLGGRYLLVDSDFAPATHLWFAGASIRGYGELDPRDIVELGISARAGLLAISGAGLCCQEFAVAVDLRLRVARGTAFQLAPEVALGTTGAHSGPDNEDYVDPVFLADCVVAVAGANALIRPAPKAH